MPNPTSAALDPIRNSYDWTYLVLAGERSPGVIENGGIRGFHRETGWDVKKGKGAQGATLTLVTRPPCKGSVTFILWEPGHFVQWGFFSTKVLTYAPTKQGGQAISAVDIHHPSLADLGISKVVIHKVSPIMHRGRGLYSVTVDFIEWIPPPPVSVAKTVASSKTGPEKPPGKQPSKAVQASLDNLKNAVATDLATPVGKGFFQ